LERACNDPNDGYDGGAERVAGRLLIGDGFDNLKSYQRCGGK
jgi:hypothetical protein